MGEGIALAFIHAGLPVTLIDIKDRAENERLDYFERVRNNIRSELQMLVRVGMLVPSQADVALSRLTLQSRPLVVCNPVAGYIVPRIQALAMNEAARMVEVGVASAEDIDTAVRVGFGLRFSVLGLLEFIDWGGGDILYYASRYLSGALAPRFESPQVIADNMQNRQKPLWELACQRCGRHIQHPCCLTLRHCRQPLPTIY
jgi:3-hydroxyacyl-CoA dehydrogenase